MTSLSKEWVRCEMEKEVFFLIPPDLRKFIEIVNVEPKDFDYSDSEDWKEAKSRSTKAYKKLKEIEFKIRNP